MAKDLSALYPGKIDIDGNNPNGTFKNRTSDALKDGTPYEKGWASDVWGFLAHILKKAVISPNGAEENEVNSQYYDALEGLVGRRKVVFETDDLIINAINSTQATASFARLSLLDSNFIPKFLNDKSLTWTMPGDLESGTSEKSSHWYGMWTDSDENLRLVPDLTGMADSTIAGSLADSTAIFLTDLVHDGDIVYNLTQLTKTKASADAAAEGQFTLDDDIFTSGDDYKIVKMSPEGLGENRERVGAASNNGSSDFDNSTYAQIQGEVLYPSDNGSWSFSGGAGFADNGSIAIVTQVEETWVIELFLDYVQTSSVNGDVTINGVAFQTGISIPGTIRGNLGTDVRARTLGDGSGDLDIGFGVGIAAIYLYIKATLDSKPTFHN